MSAVRTENTVPDILVDDDENSVTTQDISGRNISQTKLTTLLRMKFGVGAYDIHVSFSHVSENFQKLTSISPDDAQLLLHHGSKETFTCKPISTGILKEIANKKQREIAECTWR